MCMHADLCEQALEGHHLLANVHVCIHAHVFEEILEGHDVCVLLEPRGEVEQPPHDVQELVMEVIHPLDPLEAGLHPCACTRTGAW